MVELMRYAREAAGGEYICADCGYVIDVEKGHPLPICRNRGKSQHVKNGWHPLYGRRTAGQKPSAARAP